MVGRKKIVLIAGYYGYDLIGDEAILQAMLNDLRQLSSDISFIVTSQSPEKTKVIYDVEAIPICNIGLIADVIERCDLVIVGGGGVFNEYTPWRGEKLLTLHPDFNVFCASLPLLAAAHGRPCMIYAVGVEPLYSDVAKEQVASAFASATLATVRDFGSLNILKSIGVVNDVRVTADPAFRLPISNPTDIDLLVPPNIRLSNPLLGVQLRHWHSGRWDLRADPTVWETEVAKALDTWLETMGGGIIFIPFQQIPTWAFSDDTWILKRVQERMKYHYKTYLLNGPLSPSDVSLLFSQCDIILAMRYHSVILSVANATPCVALAYSLKVRSAMERSGLNDFILELEGLTAAQLLDVLRKCYEFRGYLRQRLKVVSEEMKRLAFENAELAVRLLDEEAAGRQRHQFWELSPKLLARQTNLLCSREMLLESLTKGITGYLRVLVDEDREYRIAERLLHVLLAIKEDEPEWNYLLAFCLHMQGKDLDRALKYYDTALKLGFHEFWVRYNRGSLHMELGNLEEAYVDLERAAALNVEHTGVRKRLEELVQRMSTPQSANPQQRPADFRAQLAEKERLILSLQLEISQLSGRIRDLEGELAEKETIIASLNQRLTSVYNSRRWRLASRLAEIYWRIKRLSGFIGLKLGG